MKTISIVSQKGGAGKTTLAVHIAVAGHLAGIDTAILDLDQQASAEAWGQWREDQPPEVLPAKAATLPRTLDKCRAAGAGLIVLDTPGTAEGASRSAADASDLILIPCRPAAFDLHAIQQSADLARSTGKPAFVIFNAVPPSARAIRADAREITERIGLPTVPFHLAERAIYRRATEEGKAVQEVEPEGKAAAEIAALWRWICEQVNLPASKLANIEA